jgi:hypothetical protein
MGGQVKTLTASNKLLSDCPKTIGANTTNTLLYFFGISKRGEPVKRGSSRHLCNRITQLGRLQINTANGFQTVAMDSFWLVANRSCLAHWSTAKMSSNKGSRQ